ncbi:MAG: ATP-binding protein [Selenomonadaceae bacterium]|nr:ATP-binding protein [Selenomonadaceae bacterium]
MDKWLVKSGLIGETTQYDKKVQPDFRKPKSWLKSVSAFANSLGGKLIFGVDDDDRLVGVDNAKVVSEKISEAIKDKMDPVPQIDMQIKTVEDKTLIIVQVLQGTETPYYYAGDGMHIAFVRVGNQSVKAQAHDLKRLVLKAERRSLDSLPSQYARENFAFQDLKRLYKRQTHNILTETDLESFGLLTDDGYLTNAGALMADDSPIRHSRVFCTRWSGLDKTDGLVEAQDDMEISGSLVELFLHSMDFVRRNNRLRWKKLSVFRVNMPDYPERVVQECIINALIHRDYLDVGSEVHIDIFDDRMEIYSPGGMFDGSQIQNLDIYHVASRRRNPVVADLFHRMNLMERRGSGFRKVCDGYKRAYLYRDSVKPQLFSDEANFIVTLFNLNYNVPPIEAYGEGKAVFASRNKVNIQKNEVVAPKNEVVVPQNEVSASENEVVALEQQLKRSKVSKIMRIHIMMVFSKTMTNAVFSRKDIVEWLGFSATSAGGRVLAKMKELKLVEPVTGAGNGRYRFRKEMYGE